MVRQIVLMNSWSLPFRRTTCCSDNYWPCLTFGPHFLIRGYYFSNSIPVGPFRVDFRPQFGTLTQRRRQWFSLLSIQTFSRIPRRVGTAERTMNSSEEGESDTIIRAYTLLFTYFLAQDLYTLVVLLPASPVLFLNVRLESKNGAIVSSDPHLQKNFFRLSKRET
jgi:hypothetical protein